MPAGSTYTPIATTTLGSNSNTFTFASIPNTYTDLVVVAVVAISGGATDIQYRFGNAGSIDSGSNYSTTVLTGNGTAASSIRQTSQTYILADYNAVPSSTLGNSTAIFQIMNYSNTTTFKTAFNRSNQAAGGVDATVGLWRSTAAIDTIRFYANTNGSQNFLTGSTFTLYGIASA